MVVSTLTWVEGGGGKAKKESQNRDRSKRKKLSQNRSPCRKLVEACFVCLQHSHLCCLECLHFDWKSNNQESCRLWHPHKRGYGDSAVCMNNISPSAVPVEQKPKNKVVWDDEKKKSSDVCFHLVCRISEHGTTDTVVLSRWVADSSSGWGFSPGVDGFSITNCIRWKNMFS